MRLLGAADRGQIQAVLESVDHHRLVHLLIDRFLALNEPVRTPVQGRFLVLNGRAAISSLGAEAANAFEGH